VGVLVRVTEFGLLNQYIEENGDALVPAKYLFGGHRLGAWVNEQRSLFFEGSLAHQRRERLDQTDEWVWDARAAQWEDALQFLLSYVHENGDALVPTNRIVDGFRLGQWVSIQRVRHAKKTLSEQRTARLSSVDGWVWDVAEAKWEKGYRCLVEHFEEHGTTDIPQRYSTDGYQLGSWVNTQRLDYRRKKLKPEYQERLLRFPDWNWSPRADRWQVGLQHLLGFIEEQEHAFVPQRYAIAGFALGSWVATQRTHRSQGLLRADRKARLDQIPEWSWKARDDRWEEGYNQLLSYVREHNSARVPQGYRVAGIDLGSWVTRQRTRHRQDTLTKDQKTRLSKFPEFLS
jgi:hypothetical protein